MNFNIEIPHSIDELVLTLNKFKNKNYRIGAGCTDLLMELKNNSASNLTIINISQVDDFNFNNVKLSNGNVDIGANTTAFKICENENILENYKTLHEAALNLASAQIRQVATIGGNICTASPSGDLICALMALKAQLYIKNSLGENREISILDFYKGVRKTDLKHGEFLSHLSLNSNNKNAFKTKSGFIKIGTRKSMECSVVSLAYHIQIDKKGNIIETGLAFGASAPIVKYATRACDFLIGKKIDSLSKTEIDTFAKLVVEYASPIDDIRATAWYRKQVLFNISKSILEKNIEK
ncbi:MAG: FAD binding domain-containing protein [Bacteroidetes bacterium]|nr:FAD binding domain-containing protein [Bacteroidota bacterium]